MWSTIILFLCLLSVKAEPSYRSAEIKRLVSALQLNADSLQEGWNTFALNDRQVKLLYTGGQVSFVGYDLFSDELKAVARTPIMNFLERYFLQLDYPWAERPINRMQREDRFKFETGSLATVATVRGDDAFSYVCEHNRYVATWTRDGQPILSVSFPAEHELISGENKLEAEANIEADILDAQIRRNTPVNDSTLSPTIQQDYFIKKGGTYLNKLLTSDLYFHRKDSSYTLISDISHPLESAANMMLSTESLSPCNMKIKQIMYGYKKKNYEVPLNKWIAYCQNNGCELFYGVESFNQKGIKALVIAVNMAENYNHVLFVDIPLSVIGTEGGTIDAQLETFIPMHNVKNLFAKNFKTSNKQPKIYQ